MFQKYRTSDIVVRRRLLNPRGTQLTKQRSDLPSGVPKNTSTIYGTSVITRSSLSHQQSEWDSEPTAHNPTDCKNQEHHAHAVMAIGNWERMHEYFPKHSRMGTARMNQDKETDEDCQKRGVSMEKVKRARKKSPDCLSLRKTIKIQ